MEVTKETLGRLFSDQRVYIIPVFQREYVWSRDDQWEPFANDLFDKAKQLIEAEANRQPIAHHFFGPIVVKALDVAVMALPRYEVVDGQQRLITCQIFLRALSHALLDLGVHGQEDLATLMRNAGRASDSEDHFKIQPSHRDQESFRRTMGAERSIPAQPRIELGTLGQCYWFFRDAIAGFLATGAGGTDLSADARNKRAQGLLTAVYWATFVCIGLDRNEPETEVFEALNGRGEPLLASDLIRNLVFRAAVSVEFSPAEQLTLYEAYWEDFSSRRDPDDSDQYFWHQPGTKGTARIEQFFMHFLQCRKVSNAEIRVADLLTVFRGWWEDDDWKERRSRELVKGRLQLIREQALVYSSFYELPADLDEFAPFFLRIREHDQSTVYAVLLYLFGTALPGGCVTKQDLVLICGMIESYLVRRFVCRMSTNKYNHFFLGLVTKLHEMTQITAAAFQQTLALDKNESMLWPSDDEFRRHWDTEQLYAAGNRRKTLQAMLSAIDQKLQPAFGEDVTVRYHALTVEHVLPQQWETNWPLGELTGGVRERFQPGTSDREIRGTLLHSIGNLTLLTQKLNTSMKNASYADKREKIFAHSSLPLNKYFQKRDSWNEEAILQRADTLFWTALRLWPGPRDPRPAEPEVPPGEQLRVPTPAPTEAGTDRGIEGGGAAPPVTPEQRQEMVGLLTGVPDDKSLQRVLEREAEILQLLRSDPSLVKENGEPFFWKAVFAGHVPWVKWLVEKAGLELTEIPNPSDMRSGSAHHSDLNRDGDPTWCLGPLFASPTALELLPWLLKAGHKLDRFGTGLLTGAVLNGTPEQIYWLLEQRVETDYVTAMNGIDYTPLSAAIIVREDMELAKRLIDRGACIDQFVEHDPDPDYHLCGYPSPLCMAARRGMDDFVDLLIERGAELSLDDDDRLDEVAPVEAAIQGRQMQTLRKLLAHRPDLGPREWAHLARGGYPESTPLGWAVKEEDPELVELMLECGAMPWHTDLPLDMSALALARKLGNSEIIKLLEEALEKTVVTDAPVDTPPKESPAPPLTNPYGKQSGSYHLIFQALLNADGVTFDDLMNMIVQKQGKEPHQAAASVTVVLSPRKELHGRLRDLRGSLAAQGHLYYAEQDAAGLWRVFPRVPVLPPYPPRAGGGGQDDGHRRGIDVQVGDCQFHAPSVPELCKGVLAYLVKGGHLDRLPLGTLPFATSKKRYLIARRQNHPHGERFSAPVTVGGYFMEADHSYQDACSHLEKFLAVCGVGFEVLDA